MNHPLEVTVSLLTVEGVYTVEFKWLKVGRHILPVQLLLQ